MKPKNLSLEEKIAMLQKASVSVIASDSLLIFEFDEIVSRVWIDGKLYSIQYPDSARYALANESERFELTITTDNQPQTKIMYDITFLPRLW